MWKDVKKEMEEHDANGEKDEKHSLASTHATDKDCSSSTENLITTPKRQAKPQALSALKKQESNSITNSNSKPGVSGKPFSSGVVPRRMNTQTQGDPEQKEENLTSHSLRTTNHQENNYHLSNKKAIYYNMKVYYEAIG